MTDYEAAAENSGYVAKLQARISELEQEVCSLIRRDPNDDLIERQAARIAELEAALKNERRIWIDALLENLPEEKAVLFREICLSAGDLRAARAAYLGEKE